jgi:splicing factor 3A subunit 1
MGKEDAILNEKLAGIIVPPPEVKKLIDKAADLVAKYGSSVEANLKKDEKNLPKFSFFNMDDPYRPYFDNVVNEKIKFNLNKDEPNLLGKKTINSTPITKLIPNTSATTNVNNIQDELRKIIDSKKIKITQDLKPPANDQYSIVHPNIPGVEMDIIKATAQFVARNGQKFLSGLSERESKNPLYDFIKPQHNLFGYFTHLVESYSKCLKKDDMKRLNDYADKEFIIKKATDRYMWEKNLKNSQKKKDDIDENERNLMAQIDWYDFVVVEVINFTEEELLNTVPMELGADNTMVNSIQGNVNTLYQNYISNTYGQIINEEKVESEIQPEIQLKTMDTKFEEENVPPEPGMKIVKNYIRKTEASKIKSDQIKCPLCKETVSIDDWPHHIKVELIHPKWKEVQKDLQERKKEINIANTGDLVNYLNEFSKNRTDLFGQIQDAEKLTEVKKTETSSTTIWDGFAPNMSRTSASMAMMAKQTQRNIEELNKKNEIVQEKAEINLDSSFTGYRGLTENKNISTKALTIGVTKQEPKVNAIAHNSKIDDKTFEKDTQKLIPENIFLEKNKKSFKLNVKLPLSEKYSNLKGQITTILINPTDLIGNLKEQLIRVLNIPLTNLDDSKLLSFQGEQLDESRTVSYYNLSQGKIIEFVI